MTNENKDWDIALEALLQAAPADRHGLRRVIVAAYAMVEPAQPVLPRANVARVNVEHVGTKLFARLKEENRWLTRGELLTDVIGSTRDKVDALCLLRERKQLGYRVSGSQHQYHWNPAAE